MTFYIVIPVYNAENYIERCIYSVTTQKYQDYHIFLIDDGSTDNSGRIIDSIANDNQKISVAHQTNKGQIAARETGVKLALDTLDCTKQDETVFLFADADDCFAPGALLKIADLMKKSKADLLFFNMATIEDSTKNVLNKPVITSNHVITDKGDLYLTVLFNPYYNSLCCKAVSAKLISEADYSQYYNVRYGEDLLQSLDYYRKAETVYFSTEILYEYHKNADSVTLSIDYADYPTNGFVRSVTWEFMQNEKVWTEKDFRVYLRWLQNRLRRKIIRMTSFDISFEEKAALFDRIKSDPFNSKIIHQRKKTDIVLSWLEKGKYRRLCSIFLVATGIRNRLMKFLRR